MTADTGELCRAQTSSARSFLSSGPCQSGTGTKPRFASLDSSKRSPLPARRLGALGALVLAGFVLASCGSSSPKSSSSASLSAPVITEHFTRLACNQYNTLGLEGCAETQLLEGDHRIDREMKLLFSLAPARPTEGPRQTESEFLIYRRDTCTTYGDVYEGGTFAPVEYALCEVRVDDCAKQRPARLLSAR